MRIPKEAAPAFIVSSLLFCSGTAHPSEEHVVYSFSGSRLCARAALESEVVQVEAMGMRYVRLWEPFSDVATPNSHAESLAAVAEQHGIIPVFVLTPTSLPTQSLLREKIQYVLEQHPSLILEIGNEPDNTVYEFWKDQDPSTFAAFVEMSIREIDRIDPNRPVIVAAMSNVDYLDSFLSALEERDIDSSRLYFGVHAYNTRKSVLEILTKAHTVFSRYGIPPDRVVLSEMGAYAHEQKDLPAMTDAALDMGVLFVCYHTLEDDGGEGFTLTPDAVSKITTLTRKDEN